MYIVELNSKNELNEYIQKNSIKKLGSGREGICFLLANNIVIKKLYNDYYMSYLTKFENIDIPSFTFADGGVLIERYIKAIFLKYVEGDKISKINFEKIKLSILKQALKILIQDIKILSYEGIAVKDTYSGNIIYGNDRFKLIDTQCYEESNYSNIDGINIVVIIKEIYRQMFNSKFIKEYLANSNLKNYSYDYYLISHPEELIDGIINEFYIKYGVEIDTFNDMKRVLLPK